jgi:hypothetical protein
MKDPGRRVGSRWEEQSGKSEMGDGDNGGGNVLGATPPSHKIINCKIVAGSRVKSSSEVRVR